MMVVTVLQISCIVLIQDISPKKTSKKCLIINSKFSDLYLISNVKEQLL